MASNNFNMSKARWASGVAAVALVLNTAFLLVLLHRRQQRRLNNNESKGTKGYLFIFGIGYTGLRAAKAFRNAGFRVAGTVRSTEKARQMKNDGIMAHLFDEHNDLDLVPDPLDGVTHILITAPPGENGDPVFAALKDKLKNLKGLKWVGYLSTTAVYGNRDGGRVSEDSELLPSSVRGRRRVQAENSWLQSELPTHIFRLPGIYGPGRGTLSKVRDGTARRIVKQGQIFSRIHVDDIVQALLASANSPHPGSAYNVVDDEPCSPTIVVEYACKLLNLEPPPLEPFETATMSEMARSFYSESKSVDNSKIKSELGIRLLYPTYREGLVAQLREEQESKSNTGVTMNSAYAFSKIKSLWTTLFPPTSTCCLLLDVGSLSPGSVLNLRETATQLQTKLQDKAVVFPVSCRFSDRIVESKLHGVKANILSPLLEQLLQEGYSKFVIVPLLFGPSNLLSEFVPEKVRHVQKKTNKTMNLTVADSVVMTSETDNRLALVLRDRVLEALSRLPAREPVNVVMVDHGSPNRHVTDVRNHVAAQLENSLQKDERVRKVIPASMERREGEEYSFSEPLLENVFEDVAMRECGTIVVPMFFAPGRHAGPGGDICQILDRVRQKHEGLKIEMANTVQSHPLLIEILADRFAHGPKPLII